MTESNPDRVLPHQNGAPDPLHFLIASWNRYEVLTTVRQRARRRDELLELVEVSRPTLSRILADLIEYGWIRRINHEYEATPEGRVIADEIRQFVANLEATQHLAGDLHWLPTDRFGFDLSHLKDARVFHPRPADHTGPMRELTERYQATDTIEIVATGVTYEVVKDLCQACLEGELTIDCVVNDDAIEGVRMHDDLASMFATMIEDGRCHAHHYTGPEEPIESNILDDSVMFCGHSTDGIPQGIVLSGSDVVHSWMKYYFERLRKESVAVGPEIFTNPQPEPSD